ncbi:MAG: transposase [Candidatus Helarchaeota archaeon]|nr:transposase [Candidatus Helarchaeota archaeon]
MKPLTNKQRTVLEFVGQYSRNRGFPPTLREIGEGTGLSNISAVRGHIIALEKKGYITKEAEKARSIRVVHTPSVFSKIKRQLHEFISTDKGVLHKIVYGVALVTRKRRHHFVGEQLRWIDEALEQRVVEHGWTFLRKQIKPDHIILVVEVWPNHSPELVVSRIRQAGNAVRLRHLMHFPGKSLWAKGFAATTNLESLDDMVQQLLENAEREQS